MKNLGKFYKGKKVLITGHTGFKGGWLSQILLNYGAKVSGISLKSQTKPNLFTLLNLERRTKSFFTDIRKFKKIKEIIASEKPEIIFHLAAQPLVRDSYDDPLYTFETNIIGTANILEAARKVKSIKSIVAITTDKVYKDKRDCIYKETDKLGGHDPYSSSKAAAEIVIESYIKSFYNINNYGKNHKTLIASARSGNVIGGGDWSKDRIFPDIIRAIFRNEKLIIRNPNSIRPWQHVLDPLFGYLILGGKLFKGKREFSCAWNFGPNKNAYLTVEELVKRVLKNYNKKIDFVVKRDKSKKEADCLKLNSNKAKNLLNWHPSFNIEQTLKMTIDWYNNFYKKKNMIGITNAQIQEIIK